MELTNFESEKTRFPSGTSLQIMHRYSVRLHVPYDNLRGIKSADNLEDDHYGHIYITHDFLVWFQQ